MKNQADELLEQLLENDIEIVPSLGQNLVFVVWDAGLYTFCVTDLLKVKKMKY